MGDLDTITRRSAPRRQALFIKPRKGSPTRIEPWKNFLQRTQLRISRGKKPQRQRKWWFQRPETFGADLRSYSCNISVTLSWLLDCALLNGPEGAMDVRLSVSPYRLTWQLRPSFHATSRASHTSSFSPKHVFYRSIHHNRNDIAESILITEYQRTPESP